MNNENLQQLFDLLDTMPNPITLNELAYDEDGEAFDKIIYINKSFIKNIGYTLEDIPSDRTWFEKAYPDPAYQAYIAQEWFKAIDKAKEEGTDLSGFPAKIHCKNGEEKWFSVTTQLSHSIAERYRTIVFVQTDSPGKTKLDLDEKSIELMQEKHLLETIIDTAPIRIFWKDKDGVYLGCNKSFLEDAHLKDKSEIIGKTDFDQVWKEDADRFREDDRRVIESGVSELNFVERQPQKNGEYIMLSTSKVPLKDGHGNCIGILGLYQDITEEYEAKEALQEQEKFILIQSRQAAMGEMISMIAHQWRQPLSTIAAISNHMQLQHSLGKSVDEDVNGYAESISKQVQYLSQTINDFRGFFKQNKEKEEVVASEAVDKALEIVGELLQHSNIEFRRSYNSNTIFTTYVNELQQVCINLIKNAADILLEKESDEKWIEVLTYDEEGTITIEISDNAGGINEDIIDKIFEPYFSTKDAKIGTGLGLYMSKMIVEKHIDGHLSCHNREDGAVFKIMIPAP